MEFNNDILEAYKDKDWFLDWLGFKSLREDMIDFFVNDPEHKNNVALFANRGLKLHYRFLDEFEKKARKSYREIHHYLVNSGLSHSDSLLFTYDVEDFKHYLGTYKMDWYSFPLIRHILIPLRSNLKTRNFSIPLTFHMEPVLAKKFFRSINSITDL